MRDDLADGLHIQSVGGCTWDCLSWVDLRLIEQSDDVNANGVGGRGPRCSNRECTCSLLLETGCSVRLNLVGMEQS
jgi:hypothetical protein